MEILENP